MSTPSTLPNRAGMSVVEVLVALILVTFGLLGIAGSTTLALRTTLDSAHRRAAAYRASSRLSQLSATGCTRASSGSAVHTAQQLTEHWNVTPAAGGFVTVTDSVTWTAAHGPRSFTLNSAILC